MGAADNSTKSVTKPVLVFVHGYLGGSQQWDDQVKTFSASFRVLTPDLPGFGLNNQQRSPDSIRGFADYVLNELAKQGVEQFYLVGHSMGGMIAQEIAATVPERLIKLVLYGTGPLGVMPGRFETIDESKQRLKHEGVVCTARRISATWFTEGEDSPAYSACMRIAVQASEQAALAALSAMDGWSGEQALARITPPTLIIWGDQDRSYQWAMPERLWWEIPDTRLSVIAGCSHAVHLEKPGLFNAVLQDFL